MFCQACGAKLLEGARFCGQCGTPLAQREPEQPTMIRPPAETPARLPAETPARQLVPPPADEGGVATGEAGVAPPAQPEPYGAQYNPGQYAAPPQGRYPTPVQTQYNPPTQSPYGPEGPGGPGQYGAPQPPYGAPPRKKDRLPLWIGLAATAIIIIGAAVAVWLFIIDKDDTVTTSTTKVAASTTTTLAPTTTSTATSTTTSTASSTTITLPAGEVGDSPGQWVEVDLPGLPAGEAYVVAVSDQAVLVDLDVGDGYALYAYLFESGELVRLPIDGPDFGGEDIDGLTAVWWEGRYDEATLSYSDEYIYTYRLPNGPKVKIAGGDTSVYYPQIAGQWVTWVQEERWQENPDEYYFSRVFGSKIDASGNPQGHVVELVPGATSYAQGDTEWRYSLSETHLAWENAVAVDVFDPGIYTMSLDDLQPQILKTEVWRPSTSGTKLVYTGAGLMAVDLGTGEMTNLDPQGDFASAAPSFAAYFRPGGIGYDVVARGYTGSYEQTLGSTETPPWFSPWIVTSANHVAFIATDGVHVFEWHPRID